MNVEAGLLSRLPAVWFGDAPALTAGGTTSSFAEVNAAANRVGSGLRSAGVARGDRLGVLAHNTPEVVETWLGLESHNIVRAVLHTHIGADAHLWSLNHIEATALIFDTRLVDVVEEIRERLETVRLFVAIGPDVPDWAVAFDAIKEAGTPEDPMLDVSEDDPVFLQLTSGTTGHPKPWIKTYRSWRAVIDHNMLHFDTFGPDVPPPGRDDVNLHFHPIQWASGFQTLYPYYLRGARTVLLDDEVFDPEVLLDTVVAEGVTGTFMPGPLLTPVLDAVEARGGFEHSLRRMVVFFGTPELLTRTTDLLGPVWAHGFGSSEQGAVTTRLLPSDVEGAPGRLESVGRSPSPFFDVAILDPVTMKRLPAGEIGEIAVRSAMSEGGYWGLTEATEEAFFEDDWFRPRDIGYMDADGYLYYADRAGDEIVVGDGVVYPHYVEVEVLKHPQVANCGVIGLEAGGSLEVVAAVLVKDGAATDGLDAEILVRFEAADAVRGPDRVVFVDELPTVLGGAKVQRKALRERLAAAGA